MAPVRAVRRSPRFAQAPIASLPFTFPFRLLPTEIRHQIWRLAIPSSRTFYLRNHPKKREIETYGNERNPWFDTIRIPIILHVNHESRQIALQIFHLGFNNNVSDRHYWNPQKDTLNIQDLQISQITDSTKFSTFLPWPTLHFQGLRSVRHLAVGWYVYDDASLLSWRGEEPWSAVFLAQFPVLESVAYILHLFGTSVTRDKDEDLSESERDLTSEFYVSVRVGACQFCGSSVVTGKRIADTIRGHLEGYRERQDAKGVVWKVPRVELTTFRSPKIWSSGFFVPGAVKSRAVKSKAVKIKRAKATRYGR
jgi:hypothetical protein